MDDTQFDDALIASAFRVAARRGWQHATVAEAARTAGLPLPRARRRFPGRAAILLRFGQAADAAALDGVSESGTLKDRLFDMLMRRIDVLQAHRGGVLALLKSLPMHPRTALLLASATQRSMQWLLDASGVEPGGVIGRLHRGGLEAVWLWTVRAWMRDESADLGSTMAALDQALQHAADASRWLPSPPQRSGGAAAPADDPFAGDVAVIVEPDSGPADKVSDASGTPFPP